MEYRRSEYVGDINVDEVFEGTPDEIIRLMNCIPRELKGKELVYDQDDAIDFIAKDLNMSADRNGLIKEILESEEDYMRSAGIIED